MPNADEPLPLAGIRVADFSRVVAGPYSTYLLARMGAEVIKVEGVNPLDHTREVGPYSDEDRSRNRSGYFNSVNGGKKSVTLHLQDREQAALAKEVALSSDVVVESFMFGVMERFGLGFETLAAVKPELVMVSCSGFGRTGPMRSYSAYMNTIAAFVGLTSLNSEDGKLPMPVGATFSDLVAGTSIAFASLLALRLARATGQGSHVDLAMAEATMALMGEPFSAHFSGSDAKVPASVGAFRGVFRTSGDDKWVAMSLTTLGQWDGLINAMQNPAWARSERFSTPAARAKHRPELDALITAWTRQFDNIELTETLQAAGLPALPSSDPEDVVRNPHFRARGAIAEQDYALEPGRAMPNLPWHFLALPELDRSVPAPPTLGQHNREILSSLASANPALIEAIELQAAIAGGQAGGAVHSRTEDSKATLPRKP